jgi:subtilase family serine protease
LPTGYDDGWALEATLDIEWAHALAPAAKILLVEADSDRWGDMLAAVDYARQNADFVSLSWSGSESTAQLGWNDYFTSPAGKSVTFFAASGDNGTPAEFPSASPNVISVGGTTLKDITSDPPTETGWSGSGGGCSKYQTATQSQASWYSYAQVNCKGKRATPDVSLDADPASGVAVYITGYYTTSTTGTWYRIGGTSAATPMWAGRAASQHDWDPTQIYQGLPQTRDITSGNNGASAKIGYDLVTGRGSWFDGPLPASQQPPTASFSTVCSANTCTFKSTSTGSSLKYAWILSDKVIGTSATLKRSFSSTAVADYPITLKATNPYGTSSVTHTVSCALVSGTKVTCTQAPEPSPTS